MNRLPLALTLALALGLVSQLQAQVGNDNPTGPSGIFNGNITTGCSYDPYTGNAIRKITDITVAGAVGSYGLSFSRISNSRGAFDYRFGMPGAWRHSYRWEIDAGNTLPVRSYSVQFPDGRYENFQYSPTDPIYFRAGTGVRERFQPVNTSTMLAYLILADGGKVEFQAILNSEWDPDTRTYSYWYSFVAQAIIDPYGLRTTFTYGANGELSKVTEPAGRSITINWGSVYGFPVITSVQASDGRTVTYNYGQAAFSPGTRSYVYLSSVNYYSLTTATYTYQAPNVPSYDSIPLLSSCNDPMYDGPMKKISYTYQTTTNLDGTSAVYGQIKSENYPGGAAVSSLTVNTSTTRTETRADGKTRTFTYSNAYCTSWTDFKGVSATQTWDANQYINSVTDRNGHKTTMTRNALNGAVTSVTSPVASDVVPSPAAGTVTNTYGSSACADPNNQDANNPYYVCTAKDEGNHVTTFTRNANKRITRIDYPDGGYETFAYNSFGEVTSHPMTTGGTETFTYDSTNGYVRSTYRNPSNASGNPTARYQYDALDRVSGVTDALGSSSGDPNHTTNFTYNTRGQVTVTTHPTDPVDGVRHTVTNTYNPDGTLQSTKDELSHTTSYTYDDYRRVRSVTTPLRITGDTTNHTANYFYDANGHDYWDTDPQPTQVTLPSGKLITNIYDANFRKTSVTATAANGLTDIATTRYGYDTAGNLTTVTDPLNNATTTTYDERNRPKSVTDALGKITNLKYNTAGRKASVTRSNGQITTYDGYDAMNRLLQQTVNQSPNPSATTKYTYTPAGLLATMQDPRLVATASTDTYTYAYDTTGRKTNLTYPPESVGGAQRVEHFSYDTAGRLSTFTNRTSKVQTFTYDALNRMTGFSWNDGVTPSVTFGYDVAARLKTITNANATISRSYFNDNLLKSETSTYADNVVRTVAYTYDADANRATVQYPFNAYSFTYGYTGRNQLKSVADDASGVTANYWYDVNGNLSQRNPGNSTTSAYLYDELNRVTDITHTLVGDTRTFKYHYDSVGNRSWTKRDNGTGDVFGYDLNDQVTAVKLDIANPDTPGAAGSPTIVYDANGNRTSFAAYGTTDSYQINELNQYISLNSAPITYTVNANLKTIGTASYVFDAQNRLTSATNAGVTETFNYDGLNRQVSRTVGGVTTYNVYNGWDLIGEYASGAGSPTNAYLSGAGGLIKNLKSGNYYYQDGSGSTSHLADSTGHLLEWYRYDLQGTPFFYNFANTQQSASACGVRHLFTGQQWYSELGLYDLRNRFYSPDIGRFLQPDPIGFDGDPTNLYCYAGNNPVVYSDPTGLFRGGQFAVGAGATVGGFIITLTTGESVVGALAGGGLMLYGIDNVVASFSNDPAAVAALGHPTNFSGLAGRAIAGETGQVVGGTFEDIIGARAATTAFEKAMSAMSLAKDAYDAARLLKSEFGGYGSNAQSQPGNFSSRYVFQGFDSGSYGYFDNQTHTEIVVGFPVGSGLGSIGDQFDFSSGNWGNAVEGVSEQGTAILNAMNFGLTMSEVFGALGGGGACGLAIKAL
jgi:RHS repeat-associated protein